MKFPGFEGDITIHEARRLAMQAEELHAAIRFDEWCAERESSISMEEPAVQFAGRLGECLMLERIYSGFKEA